MSHLKFMAIIAATAVTALACVLAMGIGVGMLILGDTGNGFLVLTLGVGTYLLVGNLFVRLVRR